MDSAEQNVSSVPPDEGTPSRHGPEAVSTGVHHGRSSRREASSPQKEPVYETTEELIARIREGLSEHADEYGVDPDAWAALDALETKLEEWRLADHD